MLHTFQFIKTDLQDQTEMNKTRYLADIHYVAGGNRKYF